MPAHRMVPTPMDGEEREAGTLTLSMVPPSLNNAFVNAGRAGRIKSQAYRSWQVLMHLDLRKQRGWHVRGPIKVEIAFNRAETRADCDNLIKPCLDLLVSAGRISDDRNVHDVRAYFDSTVRGARIDIEKLA